MQLKFVEFLLVLSKNLMVNLKYQLNLLFYNIFSWKLILFLIFEIPS